MYLWYKRSSICYAYLSDVPKVEFQHSRWFTRGWTLQETIAPDCLEFYSSDWQIIGTRQSRQRLIWEVTGIPTKVLCGQSPDSYSVAHKMSWAAKRTTTKPEDLAYCLMGIFHVNMPMLYGEGGSNAFYRLQRGIMEITEDHTLFTWKQCKEVSADQGLLASSPRAFLPSPKDDYNPSDLVHMSHTGFRSESEPPLLTGRGLRIQLDLLPYQGKSLGEGGFTYQRSKESGFQALLDVKHRVSGNRAVIYIAQTAGKSSYHRLRRNFEVIPQHVRQFYFSSVYGYYAALYSSCNFADGI